MKTQAVVTPPELVQLRSYRAPWKGELLLVCTKCTRKLKKKEPRLASVKKWFKKRAKDAENGQKVHLIGVNCVKMCPKNGITVATQAQLGHTPAQVSILYTEKDFEALYTALTPERAGHAAY